MRMDKNHETEQDREMGNLLFFEIFMVSRVNPFFVSCNDDDYLNEKRSWSCSLTLACTRLDVRRKAAITISRVHEEKIKKEYKTKTANICTPGHRRRLRRQNLSKNRLGAVRRNGEKRMFAL